MQIKASFRCIYSFTNNTKTISFVCRRTW